MERDERIRRELPAVRSIARAIHFSLGKNVDLEDLVACGAEGLVEAAMRFDYTKGIPFRAFASYRIRGAIVDGIRAQHWLGRRAYGRLRTRQARTERAPANDTGGDLAEVPGLLTTTDTNSLLAVITESGEACDDARWNGHRMAQLPVAEDDSLEVLVAAELRRLPERERHLVSLCYYQGKTLTEAAHEMGIRRSWASRLHARALATLRAAVEKQATGLSDRQADRSIESLLRNIRGGRSRRGSRIS